MNFKQFGSLLPDNPLCGISTYKDELNLATGACTRKIKKLMLDGTEAWFASSNAGVYYTTKSTSLNPIYSLGICDRFVYHFVNLVANLADGEYLIDMTNKYTWFRNNDITTLQAWKAWLAQQYANGTPVTVWYALETPTTETITVPSGLSGIEEGYLIQDSTPTPTNPIYPTANEVKVCHDIPHYIMGTDTDTITTLPAVLYPNDTTATVGLKGNTVQNGTPTPENPVMPQGTGERTGNLFDKSVAIVTKFYATSQNVVAQSDGVHSFVINCAPNTTYTITKIASNRLFVYQTVSFPTNGIGILQKDSSDTTTQLTFSTTANTNYIIILFAYEPTSSDPTDAEIANSIMLNYGPTAKPYEPHGYKIPISSADTTTNIYIGKVVTTRKIKKLVFNGTENWQKTTNFLYLSGLNQSSSPDCFCTHYKGTASSANYTCTMVGNLLRVYDSTFSTVEEFKTYLATQYAAGTPVTVWYVLAIPTTGIVNEPLMKIGNYADGVANVAIPVTAGGDTLSVGTTVQPSEVTVNYKGWHPVADVHECDNGAWT